jgi:hypothetical protein
MGSGQLTYMALPLRLPLQHTMASCRIQWLYLAVHGCKTYLNLNLTNDPNVSTSSVQFRISLKSQGQGRGAASTTSRRAARGSLEPRLTPCTSMK